MPFDVEDTTFLLAGPVKMHPRVLRAMSRPAMAHRDPAFRAVNREIRELLQYVFQTGSAVTLMSGSGTLGMEAAAASVLQPGDKAVALVNGKFGDRFAQMAGTYGDVTTVRAPYGEDVPLDDIAAQLADVRPKAVFLTHNESSAGFTWPLQDIAKLAHDHGALVVADCITSIGGLDVKVDAWGVDVAVVGSQKCLGAPAGLVAVSANDRAREAMVGRGFYLNLPKALDKFAQEDTPFTPAIPLHLAFLEALRLIKEEGLQERVARIRRQADAVRAAAQAMGLELHVTPERRSDTVTAIRYPGDVKDAEFRKALKERYGVILAGGQDELKGRIFRIGHMGTVSFPDLAGGLAAVEKVLKDQGASVKPGAWAEAFTSHM